jgi:hypothetical protein
VVVLAYEPKTLRATPSHGLVERFQHPRLASRGRAWIEIKDWHVLRRVDELVAVDDKITTPVVVMRTEVDYESSALGMLPKRIAIATFERTSDKKAPHALRRAVRQTVSYDGFKRFDVATSTEKRRSSATECYRRVAFQVLFEPPLVTAPSIELPFTRPS